MATWTPPTETRECTLGMHLTLTISPRASAALQDDSRLAANFDNFVARLVGENLHEFVLATSNSREPLALTKVRCDGTYDIPF